MAFGLRKVESVKKGLKRLLAKEVESAVENLGQSPLSRPAVLKARKHIKKSRALLRLVQKDLRGVDGHTEQRLRTSGRSLSQLRDASAMVGTARELCKPHGEKLVMSACQLVSENLADHEARLKHRHQLMAGAARKQLKSISRSVRHLGVRGSDEEALKRGVKRAYAKAQREMQRAAEGSSAGSFHEWRKRVKTLWYQLRLLSARAPGFRRQADQLKRLARQLGREHNLQVLQTYVARRQRAPGKRAAARLTSLAEERQEQVRQAALRAGEQFFADTPKTFVRRGFRSPRRRS
jgi:CHAD domain